MADVMQYVHDLADTIGPRPAGSDAEHKAAQYIETVFQAHGLDTEMQAFDAPRTYSWAYVIYYVLVMVAAVVAGLPMLPSWVVWPCFAVAALTAFVFWMDLDERWGLSGLMPKSPSQNVIARIEPKSRRGERVRRIVVVAHYDSTRSSFAFAPSMVNNFWVIFLLMRTCVLLVPVMILAMGVTRDAFMPWLWYATLVVAAYLLVPTFINIAREISGQWVDGANDNASGVAAMLGVLGKMAQPSEEALQVTGQFLLPVRRDEQAAEEAGVIPEGAVLTYSPAGGREGEPLPDDFQWAEAPSAPTRGQGTLEFETVEFEPVGPDRPGAPGHREQVTGWITEGGGEDTDDDAAWQHFVETASAPDVPKRGREAERKPGLLGRFKRKDEAEDMRGWLGVDEDFDARKAGAEIGTWDKFGDDDEDDGDWGLKGGLAGDDPLGDPEYTRETAARIRRKVTEMPDREFSDKEVWFVATGAEETGTWGMRHFLEEYGEELRDAFIINIDNVGAGSLYWITAEGMARRRRADRRLTGLAKRVSREHEILVKGHVYKGLSTDGSCALARGYKAMSIMAFGGDGAIVNWHWPSDTSTDVVPELVERTATFVAEMIREA